MSFVDELRSMPSHAQIAEEEKSAEYSNDLRAMHYCIKDACKRNRDDRCAKGYIFRTYDDEYCVRGIQWSTTLVKDNSRNLGLPNIKKGARYRASLVSDSFYHARQGNEPLSSNPNECKRFVNDLRTLLQLDGFNNFTLDVHTCLDEYDIVEFSGFWNPKPSLVHHASDTVLGYTISFEIRW